MPETAERPPVRYRYAEPSDAEAIADYHVRCWHESYRGLLPDNVIDEIRVERTLPQWQTSLRTDPGESGIRTVVATLDGVAVGHVTVGPERSDSRTEARGELWALYVDPRHHRRGIGRELLTMAMRLLRQAGYAEVVLWTIPGNEPAIVLYESFGWRADGESASMPSVNADLHVEELRFTHTFGDDAGHVRHNRSYWNAQSGDYRDAGRRLWSGAPQWGVFGIPDTDANILPDVEGCDVVELGCGTGYVSAWCLRAGARSAVGLDNSPAQLATATVLQAEFGVRFPLILADAERVPLLDQSFDVAISEYGAAIWCDPYRWIPEAARLLRPGGTLVFLGNSLLMALSVDDFDGYPATRELRRPQRGLHHLHWPDDDSSEFHLPHGDMIRLLRTSGFEVIDLIELYADPDDQTSYGFVDGAWASRWPHEEAWVAKRLPG